MASAAGSPDTTLRALPSWANPEPSEQFEEALKALDSYKKKDPSKGPTSRCILDSSWLGLTYFIVIVRFKAIGNAPIMKQNFYKITSSNRFQAVIQFLRKELGWQASEPLVSFPISFIQFIHYSGCST